MASRSTPAKAAPTAKGVVLTRQQTADHFGAAPTTVDNWVRGGCPRLDEGGRGKAAQFNSLEVHKWLLAQASDGKPASTLDGLKERKAAAEAELLELELAKKKEEVVELPLVQRALSAAFADIQARLRNLPGRLVSSLLGETDEQRFKDVMGGEIDQSLEQLATLDLTGLADESDDEDADEELEE